MILSYRDKRTRTFADGKRVKAFGGFSRTAERRLDQLDAATSLLDLDLPGNRLEALK
jgi:proteic killer suppression protein